MELLFAEPQTPVTSSGVLGEGKYRCEAWKRRLAVSALSQFQFSRHAAPCTRVMRDVVSSSDCQ